MLLASACAAGVPCVAAAQSFTSIDGPGASETRAHGINDQGEIVGSYSTGGQSHGYLRTLDGTFYTLDYPGAIETRAQGVNAPGDVVGEYADSSSVRHGFLRQKSNGSFTTIDVPGADLTAAFNINSEGDVAGVYLIAGVSHGFVRYSDGSFVVIDFPGAASTIGGSINERGDLSGAYVDNAGGRTWLHQVGAYWRLHRLRCARRHWHRGPQDQ